MRRVSAYNLGATVQDSWKIDAKLGLTTLPDGEIGFFKVVDGCRYAPSR